MQVRPLSGALGAEITGVDLSKPFDTAQSDAVRRVFREHLVLLFRGQSIQPADQITFTTIFGPVEGHPLQSRRGLDDHPEVLVLENKLQTPGARNDFWHSDISFAEKPPACSVLHGRTITEGYGDTMFCNMYAVYDELSDGMRQLLGPLTAMHTSERLIQRNSMPGADTLPISDVPPPVGHPVVRTHPETGRKAIFVNPYFTSHFHGMSADESRPLLDYLQQRASRPENVYRHHWREKDVLLWDNRCAMHYAVYDYDHTRPRLMHRTTAGGDRPR
jgi:taurine dioxygenase